MSNYPYTGQLAPAVGNGLGGLPRRELAPTTPSPIPNYSLIRNSFFQTEISGMGKTTYPASALIDDDLIVLMTDTSSYLKKGITGAITANTSLASFFGTTTATNRTLVRIIGTNYVIANTYTSGSWKVWLLKVNDFSLPIGSITFTPVQDITSLSLFTASQAHRSNFLNSLGGGLFIISFSNIGSTSSKTVSIISLGVDTLSETSSLALSQIGRIFPVKKYKNCYFMFGSDYNGQTTSIHAFRVVEGGVLVDFAGSGVQVTANSSNSYITALDSESVTFADGRKFTANINTNSLVLETGVFYTNRTSFCPYNSAGANYGPGFSTDQTIYTRYPIGEASEKTHIIRPDPITGILYGEKINVLSTSSGYCSAYNLSFVSTGFELSNYYTEV